jgi:xylan 1,4-beta-xylosidase
MLRLLPFRPLVLAALTSLAGCSDEPAPAREAIAIRVDATAPGVPLEPVWAYHGYDEPNYTTTADGRELLASLSSRQRVPVYARTHFLFNTGDGTAAPKWGSTNVYTEDAAGNPVYDYTLLDGIMDATTGAGVRPFFELGLMPKALSTQPDPYENSGPYALDGGAYFPPRDYDKWGKLVESWAAHVAERYPAAEDTWQWELWNEPDLPYWLGTVEEFTRLYDYTEAALHAVLPRAPLGGPAVAGSRGFFFQRFLRHCVTGTNAVTGQTGTRLDLISFHAKGGVSLENGHVRLSMGNQLTQHRSGFQSVTAWPTLADTPIVISEADPDACAACPASRLPTTEYRTSPAYGAYVVEMMKRSLELAEEDGVKLRGVLTWAFTFPDAPYFAGYRELSTRGIHLPVLGAFHLLGQLGRARVPLVSEGARPLAEVLEKSVREEPDVDGMATTEDGGVQVLVWNYHDDLVDAEPANIDLTIALPGSFGRRATVIQTRVDTEHGDAFSVWVAQGRPQPPSAQQLDELRAAMDPVKAEPAFVDVTQGTVKLSFVLPRFGLSLVSVTPAD